MSTKRMGCVPSREQGTDDIGPSTGSFGRHSQRQSAYSKRQSPTDLKFIEQRVGSPDHITDSSGPSQELPTQHEAQPTTSQPHESGLVQPSTGPVISQMESIDKIAQVPATEPSKKKSGWLENLRLSSGYRTPKPKKSDHLLTLLPGTSKTYTLDSQKASASGEYRNPMRLAQPSTGETATFAENPLLATDTADIASISEQSFVFVRRNVIAAWGNDAGEGFCNSEITLHHGPSSIGGEPTHSKRGCATDPKLQFHPQYYENGTKPKQQAQSAEPTETAECASTPSSGQLSATPSSQGYAGDQESNQEEADSFGASSHFSSGNFHRPGCPGSTCNLSGENHEGLTGEKSGDSDASGSIGGWTLRNLKNWSAISNWHLRRSVAVCPSSMSESNSSVDSSRVPLMGGMPDSFRGLRRAGRWGSPKTRLMRSRTVDTELFNDKTASSGKTSGYSAGRKAESVSPRASRLNLFSSNRASRRNGVRNAPVSLSQYPPSEMTSSQTVSESLFTDPGGSSAATKACLPVLDSLVSRATAGSCTTNGYSSTVCDNGNSNESYYPTRSNRNLDLGCSDSVVATSGFSQEEKMEWGDIARVHMDFFNEERKLQRLQPTGQIAGENYQSCRS